jgi:hypothetical protein
MGEEHSTVEAGGKEYGDAVIRSHAGFAVRGARLAVRDSRLMD